MANTATLIDTIPIRVGKIGPVYEYELNIDTTGTDLTVRDPAVATNRIWVVGIFFSESTATNLTLKSGTTKSHTLELASNQGITGFTDQNGFYFVTLPGDSLIIQSSAAITTALGKDLVLRVVEGLAFNRG